MNRRFNYQTIFSNLAVTVVRVAANNLFGNNNHIYSFIITVVKMFNVNNISLYVYFPINNIHLAY